MHWKTFDNLGPSQIDFVLTTTFYTDTSIPLMAPAALKPVIEKAGLSCLAIDINAEMIEYVKQHKFSDSFVRFFFEEKLNKEIEQEIFDIFDSVTDKLISYNPKYIGLSVFSFLCQASTKWLCYFITKKRPDIKILIGGPGCLPKFTGTSKFVKLLQQNNLIDYHIRGDAEHSLYQLLIGNDEYEGINSATWKNLKNSDLEKIPTPDYSNYKFELYTLPALPIVGSRGCVRQCTFCDYITNWKKFQWRTADHVFEEMLAQYKRYNIRFFKFQDSLVNGNMKESTRLLELIADYNDHHPEEKFSWAGFWIFRERSSRSEREWELVAKSGAILLAVGIESFSQRVRYSMGKKFSDESIIFHYEQALKWKVICQNLIIVGYINETQEDIDIAKQWLRDNLRFKDVIRFCWGSGLAIFDDTYLGENKDALGIKMIGPNPHEWISTQIPSTPEQRRQWSIELRELSYQLGWQVEENDHDNHFLLEKSLYKKYESMSDTDIS